MMKNGRTIRIKSGVVNIPVVEHINTEKEFEASIFTEQYVQALDALNNLVAAQSASSKQSDNRVSPEESPNNIIAFVGERGSGNTSCMSSVAELLAPEKLHEIKSKYTAIEKHQFENIGIIDPSYFDQTHNIVAMVVAGISSNTNTPNPDVSTYSENWSRLSPGHNAACNVCWEKTRQPESMTTWKIW